MVIKMLPQYFQALKLYKEKALELKGEFINYEGKFMSLTNLCLQNIIMWGNEDWLRIEYYSNRNPIRIDGCFYYVSFKLPVTWEVSRVVPNLLNRRGYTIERAIELSARLKVVLLYHLYVRGIW